ncbi:hypothetical protein [Natronobacterium gregoryi]|uniref:Uncharacterized protein n=1 Tax=Natronobacterium gregoryi (strain ATCC 43098 / DSM 3393 / CCM 3738 / CIP 104747 / IAM 13177 / JCM 8860 / NBRC 102187 / NCIMB 2189 / SP2) TaxID=797304 RepID=A0A2J4JE83_NATGS|nr:hypothetical protein [Natronobacterium gregoryi]PLK20221.1 hypothetical protein CYV19_11050 [Natronobacterium gregoryi SP2]
MVALLPRKYNLLLLLVTSLLYPIAGLLLGEPFTNPTIADLVVTPAVILLFANLGYIVQSQHGESGVVDERDVQNIDLALSVTGVVLLISILVIYIGHAVINEVTPAEVDYLALAAVGTIFVVLGGTEIYHRL